jgi:hypothetical protein
MCVGSEGYVIVFLGRVDDLFGWWWDKKSDSWPLDWVCAMARWAWIGHALFSCRELVVGSCWKRLCWCIQGSFLGDCCGRSSCSD